MSANWQKIGGVEVCEGTDGSTGVYNGMYVDVVFGGGKFATYYSKEEFESKAFRPLHEIEECADGSVIVRSVEKIDGGMTARCAMVKSVYGRWVMEAIGKSDGYFDKENAIAAAVAYVSAR